MESIYALNPVVTDDATFAQRYNDDFMSAYCLSECLSFNEAKELISRNASFDRVVFLGDESAFGDKLKNEFLNSASTAPELIAISKGDSVGKTVKKVHNEIRDIRKGTG